MLKNTSAECRTGEYSFSECNLPPGEVSYTDCLALRQRVLWPDKPLSFSRVPGDGSARHFGITRSGILICCLSVFQLQEHCWQIRKFATLPEWQHQGVGSTLLSAVIALLTQEGAQRFELDARLSAADFYRKRGFLPCSAPFENKGLQYIRMAQQAEFNELIPG
ncbi:GNAT family N-acetyltransferase [Tatumella sp. UCD-D_suzukii]|uniref:GNAT family N-acetyltransferase n=1 Tax=Tatumella sp. UCD-D_suzukii TaxID=1408192 RepID=UPI000471CC1A|nr:GNAT family N-acetyltransferase [Tatumella sp. UCD-D_suzukii]